MPRFKKYVVIWVAQLILLSTSHKMLLSAQPDSAPGGDRFARFEETVSECHEGRFASAIDSAEQLCARYPQDPAGVLALMYVYQSISDSYRVTEYLARIDSLAGVAVKLSRAAIKKDRRRGINYLSLATASGTRSLSFARQGKWLDAFKNGKVIKRSFEKAIACDPELYDAYYGLGVYNYWLAAKSRVLSLLLTSRNEAIKQVKLAVEKGRFFKTTARYGLSAIYFNEGRYAEALALCDSLFRLYPNNPTLHYRRGRIFQELGAWQQARTCFQELLHLLKTSEFQSATYQSECLYQIALCEYKLDDQAAAREMFERAVELEEATSGPLGIRADCLEAKKLLADRF